MRILIVEDEARSANRLVRMIKRLRPDADICGPLGGIEAVRTWSENSPMPDLVLLDIRLEDGDAFELLDAVAIDAPVVFCTAYSEYALRAFQVNSIDYLLKPIELDKLAAALHKYAALKALNVPPDAWRHLRAVRGDGQYRDRFLVAGYRKLRVVPVEDVVAIEAWQKVSRLFLTSGEQVGFDEPLYQVAQTLDPHLFLQISRSTLVRVQSIHSVDRASSGAVTHIASTGLSFPVSRTRLGQLVEAMKG